MTQHSAAYAVVLRSVKALLCAPIATRLSNWIIETINEPKDTDPKEYVIARLKAPMVGCFGMPAGDREQKYQEPYTDGTN